MTSVVVVGGIFKTVQPESSELNFRKVKVHLYANVKFIACAILACALSCNITHYKHKGYSQS